MTKKKISNWDKAQKILFKVGIAGIIIWVIGQLFLGCSRILGIL